MLRVQRLQAELGIHTAVLNGTASDLARLRAQRDQALDELDQALAKLKQMEAHNEALEHQVRV